MLGAMLRRKKVAGSTPGWWIRAGERLCLGLDLMQVLGDAGEADWVRDLDRELRAGRPVVEAMRSVGMNLPMEAWSLLEAGEHTGRLGEAMREVGALLEERREHRRALAGQLWYPAMVLLVAAGVMGILLLWVIPQLREMALALDPGNGLPWLTENLGRLYGGLLGAGLAAITLLSALAVALGQLSGRSERAARIAEVLHAGLPFWGRIRHRQRIARLLRQLGTLLHGGTTLPAALEQVAAGAPSRWEAAVLRDCREGLLMGMELGEVLEACPLMDPESVPLLEAGQEGGRLDHYLEQVGRNLERDALRRIQQLTRFLEPAFLLFLSLLVGGLLLAYLLPMVQLLEEAGGTQF